MESTILSLKHQKHQNQSGIVKAMEQEKLSLKKELSSANRKVSFRWGICDSVRYLLSLVG